MSIVFQTDRNSHLLTQQGHLEESSTYMPYSRWNSMKTVGGDRCTFALTAEFSTTVLTRLILSAKYLKPATQSRISREQDDTHLHLERKKRLGPQRGKQHQPHKLMLLRPKLATLK